MCGSISQGMRYMTLVSERGLERKFSPGELVQGSPHKTWLYDPAPFLLHDHMGTCAESKGYDRHVFTVCLPSFANSGQQDLFSTDRCAQHTLSMSPKLPSMYYRAPCTSSDGQFPRKRTPKGAFTPSLIMCRIRRTCCWMVAWAGCPVPGARLGWHCDHRPSVIGRRQRKCRMTAGRYYCVCAYILGMRNQHVYAFLLCCLDLWMKNLILVCRHINQITSRNSLHKRPQKNSD